METANGIRAIHNVPLEFLRLRWKCNDKYSLEGEPWTKSTEAVVRIAFSLSFSKMNGWQVNLWLSWTWYFRFLFYRNRNGLHFVQTRDTIVKKWKEFHKEKKGKKYLSLKWSMRIEERGTRKKPKSIRNINKRIHPWIQRKTHEIGKLQFYAFFLVLNERR